MWLTTSAIKADGMLQIIHDSKCLHDIFLDKTRTINMLLYVVNKLIIIVALLELDTWNGRFSKQFYREHMKWIIKLCRFIIDI